MAIGDLIRVDVNQSLQSSQVQNVIYYLVAASDAGVPDVEVVADLFISDVLPAWAVNVSADVMFECIFTQKVFPLPIGARQERAVVFQGGVAGESLPAMNAGLIQKSNPAVPGRGKKGRIYIPGWNEADQELGRLEIAAFGRLQSISTVLDDTLSSAGGGAYDPAWAIRNPAAPFEVTGFVEAVDWTALPRLATQRRRRTPVRSVAPV